MKKDETINVTSTQRLSDDEINQLKIIIHQKRDVAIRTLKEMQGRRLNENGTDDTGPTFKILEEGHNCLNAEEIGTRINRMKKHLADLDSALIRVEHKTIGICRVTKKRIAWERIISVPHATLSVEGKQIEEKEKMLKIMR
jgi:DnaK suppressor protein